MGSGGPESGFPAENKQVATGGGGSGGGGITSHRMMGRMRQSLFRSASTPDHIHCSYRLQVPHSGNTRARSMTGKINGRAGPLVVIKSQYDYGPELVLRNAVRVTVLPATCSSSSPSDCVRADFPLAFPMPTLVDASFELSHTGRLSSVLTIGSPATAPVHAGIASGARTRACGREFEFPCPEGSETCRGCDVAFLGRYIPNCKVTHRISISISTSISIRFQLRFRLREYSNTNSYTRS